ncbi:MAG: 2-oxo acid dehydrogenase subunit E2, partial [Burkholderiales bacterium]
MLIEVKVPVLSESVVEATLLSWHKKQGEYVQRDENLIDIETDKVILELPAPGAGVLAKIIKNDGATVASNEVIATIDTNAKPAAAASLSTEAKPQAAKSNEPVLMPAAKKLVAESKLDAAEISSSGRGGRITKADVVSHQVNLQQAAANMSQPSTVKVTAVLGDRPEQRVPMTRLRARIAERLVQSQHAAAILTTFNEVNMQPVIELRNRYKEKFEKEHGIKLGFMSFFVKAAVAALKKFPIVNASIDGNDIVYHGYFDIGIAVSSSRGLVVPIIRNADQLSLAEIEKQIADFGTRAQEGKL